MKNAKTEIINLALKRSDDISLSFIAEVNRLLDSGAIDPDTVSRGLLFGTALENVADNYLRGERKTREYRNLKCF